MSTYLKYIESEIPWVGKMPSHWKKIRHKNIFKKVQHIVGEESSKYEVLSLTMKGVIKRDVESNLGKMPASFDGYQIVEPGNLLLCLFDIDVTPRCIGFVESKGITTAAYTNVKVINDECYSKYYYYWFLMLDMDKTLLHLSKNLRNSIGSSEFMALTTIMPPLKEQKEISDYLDEMISEIDFTINLMEKYIEKINEQRQSIITEVMTKGLNPNVKMQDSGIEWIGEIPEHWETGKLKNLFILQRGHDLTHEEFREGMIPVYASNGIMGYHNTITTKGPNITIGRSGSVGKVNYVEGDFWAHNTCIYVKDNKKNYMKYIYYILKSIDMGNLSTQTAVPTLDRKNVQNSLFVYTLDIEEQTQITNYLDNKLDNIDRVISNINKQIVSLKDYRQALIYEVVTGKIDVRDMEVD